MADKTGDKALYRCPGCGSLSSTKPRMTVVKTAAGSPPDIEWRDTAEFSCSAPGCGDRLKSVQEQRAEK